MNKGISFGNTHKKHTNKPQRSKLMRMMAQQAHTLQKIPIDNRLLIIGFFFLQRIFGFLACVWIAIPLNLADKSPLKTIILYGDRIQEPLILIIHAIIALMWLVPCFCFVIAGERISRYGLIFLIILHALSP